MAAIFLLCGCSGAFAQTPAAGSWLMTFQRNDAYSSGFLGTFRVEIGPDVLGKIDERVCGFPVCVPDFEGRLLGNMVSRLQFEGNFILGPQRIPWQYLRFTLTEDGSSGVGEALTPVSLIPPYIPHKYRVTLTRVAELIDPRSGARPPYSFLDSDDQLANRGRPVIGVGADGAARAVLRIKSRFPGEKFEVSLCDENGNAVSDLDDYGGLATTSAPQDFRPVQVINSFTSSIGRTVAIAVYRAPIDFPTRSGGYIGNRDRAVRLKVRSLDPKVQDDALMREFAFDVVVVRPPVLFVPGLTGSPNTFDRFSLFTAPPPGWSVAFVRSRLPRENLETQAAALLNRAERRIDALAIAQRVVFIKANFVGASAGGVLVRQMDRTPATRGQRNYGQGIVHKLVTLGSPHLGSELVPIASSSPLWCQVIFAGKGILGRAGVQLGPSHPFIVALNRVPGVTSTFTIAGKLEPAREWFEYTGFMAETAFCNRAVPSGGFPAIFGPSGNDGAVSVYTAHAGITAASETFLNRPHRNKYLEPDLTDRPLASKPTSTPTFVGPTASAVTEAALRTHISFLKKL